MNPKALNPEQWVDEYGDSLFRYALFHLNDREKAEDVVQETYIAALRSLPSFTGQSSLRTWLFGILKHKIMDYYRRIQRETPLAEWEQEEDPSVEKLFFRFGHWRNPSPMPMNPDQALQESEFWKVVRQCMQGLPERMRKIFALRVLEDVSLDEICKNMELTSTNVGVILYRARLLMRECLEKNWFQSSTKGSE